MKRQSFLETFLGALGAKEILWGDKNENLIYGTVIFDPSDPDQRQDFVWHMSEIELPNDKVKELVSHLVDQDLLDGDKIRIPVTALEVPGVSATEKEMLFDELFRVRVNMIDEGQETNFFIIHD